MAARKTELSPHSKKVLEQLNKSSKPLSAYELLARLRKSGINAPPTVYRALGSLVACGLVHRIESLNAFVACHSDHADHNASFAVCRACGTATEIHDDRLEQLLHDLGHHLHFHVEREILELSGLCQACDATHCPDTSYHRA